MKNNFKVILSIFFISSFNFHSLLLLAQPSLIGHWKGQMIRNEKVMDVSFDFKIANKTLYCYFNSPMQRASGIPIDSVIFNNQAISFQLMTEPVTYFKCIAKNNSITGTITQEGFSNGTVSLKHSNPDIKNYFFSDTAYSVNAHRIACRIYFPKTAGRHPVLVFMHGSGPEGMFANQYFAESLASKGIVTVISDKQGVGHSTGNWKKASFDDLADDYISAVKFLKSFKNVNPEQIGIYGHSQGGTIAPLVASKSTDIHFIIAAASVGDSVYKQDLYRVANHLKEDGFKDVSIDSAMSYYKSWLDMARTGTDFEKLPGLTEAAKKHTWIDWVEAPPRDHWIWDYYLKTGNYNSLIYWSQIKVPTLLVYGESDRIEDIHSYIKNITETIANNQHNVDQTTVILPMAQHNLTVEPAANEKFFWWHASYGYEQLLASWILFRYRN